MPDDQNPFQIKGYGETKAKARDDAEKRLPYLLSPQNIEKYTSIIQHDAVQLEDQTWEMSIDYSLRERVERQSVASTASTSSRRRGSYRSPSKPPVRGAGSVADSRATELVRQALG